MNAKLLIALILAALLASCTANPTQMSPATPAAPTGTLPANLPNPAAVYCEQQGNKSEIRTAADGSQSGVCIFPDGNECDEWLYFRGQCGSNLQGTASAVVPTQTRAATGDGTATQTIPMPAGAVIDPRSGSMDLAESFIFYNTQGLILGELLAPRGGQVHAAGHYEGTLSLPLIFHAFGLESQQHGLYLNSGSTPADPGGKTALLRPLADQAMLSGLVGAPGGGTISYALFEPMEAGKLRSELYVATIDSLATATPVLSRDSQESSYWEPVAIAMKGEGPAGLWFTQHPWGIGGDIVFMPNVGLSYLDLSSGSVTEILPQEMRFDSLSPDQTWIAYSQRTETDYGFFIRNLDEGDPIRIATLPESDRGAGDGRFSPSQRYFVWREAQGSLFDNTFRQTIRVATPDGQSIGDFPEEAFYKAAELGAAGTMVKPVGWLDDENLLVQVTAAEKPHEGTVVELNVTTGQYSLFARGFFAGLFYP